MENMITFTMMKNSSSVLCKTGAFLNYVMKKNHFSEQYVRWQYFGNPDGEAIAVNAYDNNEIIGHYAAQPVQAKIDGQIVRGLFILNAAVDPQFQGKGILRSIADRVHEEASHREFDFMYGVGNKNSTPIYTKKFGFRNIGALTVKVGFGFPTVVSSADYYFRRFWTDQAISWRLNNPHTKYCTKELSGSNIVLQNLRLALTVYMGHVESDVSMITRKTINLLPLLYIGCDPCIEWSKGLFVDMPNFLKPSPLNLIFSDLRGKRFEVTGHNSLVQGLDIDAF